MLLVIVALSFIIAGFIIGYVTAMNQFDRNINKNARLYDGSNDTLP